MQQTTVAICCWHFGKASQTSNIIKPWAELGPGPGIWMHPADSRSRPKVRSSEITFYASGPKKHVNSWNLRSCNSSWCFLEVSAMFYWFQGGAKFCTSKKLDCKKSNLGTPRNFVWLKFKVEYPPKIEFLKRNMPQHLRFFGPSGLLMGSLRQRFAPPVTSALRGWVAKDLGPVPLWFWHIPYKSYQWKFIAGKITCKWWDFPAMFHATGG